MTTSGYEKPTKIIERHSGQAASASHEAKLYAITQKVFEALEALSKEEQIRVLRSVAAFYGIDDRT